MPPPKRPRPKPPDPDPEVTDQTIFLFGMFWGVMAWLAGAEFAAALLAGGAALVNAGILFRKLIWVKLPWWLRVGIGYGTLTLIVGWAVAQSP